MVIIPIAGGPSDKVGVKAGDRIVIVDGDTVVGSEITSENIMKRLKGKKTQRLIFKSFVEVSPNFLNLILHVALFQPTALISHI